MRVLLLLVQKRGQFLDSLLLDLLDIGAVDLATFIIFVAFAPGGVSVSRFLGAHGLLQGVVQFFANRQLDLALEDLLDDDIAEGGLFIVFELDQGGEPLFRSTILFWMSEVNLNLPPTILTSFSSQLISSIRNLHLPVVIDFPYLIRTVS